MADHTQSGEITTRQSGEGDADRELVGDIEKTRVQTNPGAGEGQSQYLTGVKLGLAFVGMLLSILLVALDQTIVATAPQVSWIVSGYFLTQAGLLLLYGQLLIVAPTKWIYVAAVLSVIPFFLSYPIVDDNWNRVFEIGSLFCAVAPSAEFLIFGRAIS
ncbi:unnamed protein product [Rhizoctonia solani]|uniref:Uncharacterized protein n=1 Tax=Rhizoctonia solani TaxID=456999 RepID=A0A8H2XC12_9AGAM|nr:unnamed protein product [Rhizoctonia solani]